MLVPRTDFLAHFLATIRAFRASVGEAKVLGWLADPMLADGPYLHFLSCLYV